MKPYRNLFLEMATLNTLNAEFVLQWDDVVWGYTSRVLTLMKDYNKKFLDCLKADDYPALKQWIITNLTDTTVFPPYKGGTMYSSDLGYDPDFMLYDLWNFAQKIYDQELTTVPEVMKVSKKFASEFANNRLAFLDILRVLDYVRNEWPDDSTLVNDKATYFQSWVFGLDRSYCEKLKKQMYAFRKAWSNFSQVVKVMGEKGHTLSTDVEEKYKGFKIVQRPDPNGVIPSGAHSVIVVVKHFIDQLLKQGFKIMLADFDKIVVASREMMKLTYGKESKKGKFNTVAAYFSNRNHTIYIPAFLPMQPGRSVIEDMKDLLDLLYHEFGHQVQTYTFGKQVPSSGKTLQGLEVTGTESLQIRWMTMFTKWRKGRKVLPTKYAATDHGELFAEMFTWMFSEGSNGRGYNTPSPEIIDEFKYQMKELGIRV